MFHTFAKIVRICFYAAVILFGVTFAMSNRAITDLTFYPFPYIISVPLYLFTILLFTTGLFTGWAFGRLAGRRYKRGQKQAQKRIGALENELGILRMEKTIQPVAAALPHR